MFTDMPVIIPRADTLLLLFFCCLLFARARFFMPLLLLPAIISLRRH